MPNWDWKWIIWQVIVPLAGPIIISGVVALMWRTGEPSFLINWHLIIDDLTPWALTFYSITLIGVTMNDLWPKLSAHPVLGVSLLATAFGVAIYEAFMVIWRHNDKFTPGTGVYVVAIILLGMSIYLCYKGETTT